jgi:putative MFS transporter
MQGTGAERVSIVGGRAPLFWGACAAIAVGVLLHLPMLAMAHHMGNRLAGTPMEPQMWTGMALIVLGVPAAIYAALPPRRAEHGPNAGTSYEAPDSTPLNRWHAGVLVVLTVGLVIDVMKPATLGFVLPGMSAEYGISKATVAGFRSPRSSAPRSAPSSGGGWRTSTAGGSRSCSRPSCSSRPRSAARCRSSSSTS